MDRLISLYSEFMNEAETFKGTFEEFAKSRLDGATKIAESAKEKGGSALLTYHHFHVKLPFYKKAASGKFKIETAESDLSLHIDKLVSGTSGEVTLKQIEFQKLVGIIEVLGELIIRYKESN